MQTAVCTVYGCVQSLRPVFLQQGPGAQYGAAANFKRGLKMIYTNTRQNKHKKK